MTATYAHSLTGNWSTAAVDSECRTHLARGRMLEDRSNTWAHLSAVAASSNWLRSSTYKHLQHTHSTSRALPLKHMRHFHKACRLCMTARHVLANRLLPGFWPSANLAPAWSTFVSKLCHLLAASAPQPQHLIISCSYPAVLEAHPAHLQHNTHMYAHSQLTPVASILCMHSSNPAHALWAKPLQYC